MLNLHVGPSHARIYLLKHLIFSAFCKFSGNKFHIWLPIYLNEHFPYFIVLNFGCITFFLRRRPHTFGFTWNILFIKETLIYNVHYGLPLCTSQSTRPLLFCHMSFTFIRKKNTQNMPRENKIWLYHDSEQCAFFLTNADCPDIQFVDVIFGIHRL